MVPRSDLLFENGLTETSTEGQRSFDLPETLIRFGLSSKTELRFTVPDYFQNFNMGRGAFASAWAEPHPRCAEEFWTNNGMHQEPGKESIAHIVRMYAGHDLNHLGHVENVVKGSG